MKLNTTGSPAELRGELGQDSLPEPVQKIVASIHRQCGYDFSRYKRTLLLLSIEHRMAACKIVQTQDYIAYLDNTLAEAAEFVRDLLIGVTSFFRDMHAFSCLQQRVIPMLFARKPVGTMIRIWIPGCSTGEEVYSIGMLFHEFRDEWPYPIDLQIFATDIDPLALQAARSGIYPTGIASHVSAARLARFFTYDAPTGGYRVKIGLRNSVQFFTHNVTNEPPFSQLDLISCRNLFIYMNAPQQESIKREFHCRIRAGGFLFLGASENLEECRTLFRPVDRAARLYQRRDNEPSHSPRSTRIDWVKLKIGDDAPRVACAPGAAESAKLSEVLGTSFHDRLGACEAHAMQSRQRFGQVTINPLDEFSRIRNETMSNQRPLQWNPNELRRRAEGLAEATPAPSNNEVTPQATVNLLHELLIHQIELEMQNEELRHAQEALEISRARYFDLFDLAPVSYLSLSENGLIREANLAVAVLLDLPRADLINQRFSSYIFLADLDIYRQYRNRLFETGVPHTWELRLVEQNAQPIWARIDAAVAHDVDGTPLCSMVIANITADKQAEQKIQELNIALEHRVQARTAQLTAANNDLESFSYSIAHDLQTPLRSIEGFSNILALDYGNKLDEQGLAHLERVRASARRMSTLINDLLRLSRFTRQQICTDTVDLSAMAQSLGTELRGREPDRAVRFRVAPGLSVHGDGNLLQIVLTNLLGNAWKYTCKRIEADIEFGATLQNGQNVYYVRDNGAGFDMLYAKNLFKPFQRLHSADQFEGTGIGLATVARIIHRHGGHVWAIAEIDKGATFYFSLPSLAEPNGPINGYTNNSGLDSAIDRRP